MSKSWKFSKRLSKVLLVVSMLLSTLAFHNTSVEAASVEYELYPTPQTITYQTGEYVMRKDVNVVLDSTIDEATKNRLKEVLALKNMTMTVTNAIVTSKLNILIGTKESGEYVDQYVTNTYTINPKLFNETDSYYANSSQGIISVLGKDTDAAFYGITTFYHIFGQIEGLTIRDFAIEDYADVVSRGFIEGYYGNPWSVEDRIELMKFGGYHKLNSYFYAPKDDPKHNSNWRQLYTEAELVNIKKLADAGNASKCRFVYALHPYMHNAINYSSEQTYQNDLKVLQAKFKQVIDSGVRQIAILADDANNAGAENYIKTLKDMTAWLKELQKTYPDLKLTLPFCPEEYMGMGQSYYKEFPENVQIVMTGGTVWGEVSNNFTSKFASNVGTGPYMWINWPCSDGSTKHLIMGGYDTFLHPGVNRENVKGIVLNPMEHAEPNKIALFGNAAYSWNIWQSKAEADKAWEASFKYADHGSAIETDASMALRELSKHMINQAMDSRVAVLQESVDLKPILEDFKTKLENDTVTNADIDKVSKEFKVLKAAALEYKTDGNERLRYQIRHWLDCWVDTADAALNYLEAVRDSIAGDSGGLLNNYTSGKSAFDNSKKHEFITKNTVTEIAEVGVQHIVPFIQLLDEKLANKISSTVDPTVNPKRYITNREDNPSGKKENVFDGNEKTEVVYQNPNSIAVDEYVGIMYEKPVNVKRINFDMGTNSNKRDTFSKAKLEYTVDGKTWQDVDGTIYNLESKIEVKGLDLNAKGVRLIATEEKIGTWLGVREITLNREEEPEKPAVEGVKGTITINNIVVRSGTLADLTDSNEETEVHFSKSSDNTVTDKDKVPVDGNVTFTFNQPTKVGDISIAQGLSSSGDVLNGALVQYQEDGSDEWKTLADFSKNQRQTFHGNGILMKAIRIIATESSNGWWRLGEITVKEGTGAITPISYTVMTSPSWGIYQGSETNLYDGDDSSFVWYDPDKGSGNNNNDNTLVDDYLGYDLGAVVKLNKVHVVVGVGDDNKLLKYTIETSTDNTNWTPVPGYENYTGASSGKDVLDIPLNQLEARYIRIRNLEQRAVWLKFGEFTVEQYDPDAVVGDKDYIYSNVANNPILALKQPGQVVIQPGKIALEKGKYIGVKLDAIRDLQRIDVTNLPLGLILQVSMNEVEWFSLATNSALTDIQARYIRFINPTDNPITWDISKYDVVFDEVIDKGVESDVKINAAYGDDDMRKIKNVANVFDGNLSTSASISGYPVKDNYVLFDLGQRRTFDSIRYYINETNRDYIRDADFYVSTNKEDWTKVLTVGDGVENNVFDDTTAKEATYLKHDSLNPGNMYSEARNLGGIEGRYIKVIFTTSYNHRFVVFNEIQINDGAYVPSNVNKNVIATCIEESNKGPENLFDGNISTTYKPSKANGSMTYRLSQPKDVTTIRYVQTSISNAKVVGVFTDTSNISKATGREEIELGTLNQVITEFNVPANKVLLESRIEWENTIPEIAQIITTNLSNAVSKDALLTALNENVDTSTWTASSVSNYIKAKATAQEVYDNAYMSQDSVNTALAGLNNSKNSHKVKGNATPLQEEVNKGLIDGKKYTLVSYSAYKKAFNNANEALKDINNLTQDQVEALLLALTTSTTSLIYSSINQEEAILLVQDIDAFIATIASPADVYTVNSYQELMIAKTEVEALIALNKTTPQDPELFEVANKKVSDAKKGLVGLQTLPSLIREFGAINATLYTNKTYTAYQTKINEGKELLVNGTTATITAKIKEIDDVKKGLVPLSTISAIEGLIKQIKSLDSDNYTVQSYDLVLAKANEIAAIDLNTKNNQELKMYSEVLQTVQNQLVSIESLKTLVALAMNYDGALYTTSSYHALENVIDKAIDLYQAGTKTEIEKAMTNINASIQQLVIRVNASEAKEYINSIEKEDTSKYTKESADAYLQAYDVLQALLKDLDNVSQETYLQVKEAFEQAVKGLELSQEVIKPTDKEEPGDTTNKEEPGDTTNKEEPGDTTNKVGTGDTTNSGLYISLSLLAIATMYAMIRYKRREE